MRDVILITRPKAEALTFKNELVKEGFESVISPMLEIAATDFQVPDLSPYIALIFTSAQAIDIFARYSKIRNLPIYAVGETSSVHARLAGFVNVVSAHGDGQALAKMVADRHRGEAARFLHIRGEDVAFDLEEALDAQGHKVQSLIVYKAELAKAFTAEAKEALKQGRIKTVIFFSRRTAQNFMNLIVHAGLSECLTSINALCISQSVLECVQPKHGLNRWFKVYASATPDKEGLLKLLRAL